MATGPLCGMCHRPIHDRFILQVVDIFYHEHCLQCFACGDRLYQTCFVRDSKLFCKLDYDRIYSKKCLGCSERVAPEELVMKTCESVFHVRCFACVVCGMRLQKGDQYVFKQGQVFCKPDYEKEVEMLQGYNQGEYFCDEFTQSNRTIDGRRGPKRPRTILTTQQRRAFKASFEISPKPSRKVRENLAKDTGLSVRIVQVWFQNQRAKVKKMQKKARQENKEGKDLENEEKKLNVKEEEQSPRSNSFLNDSCSNDTELDSMTVGFFQQMQQTDPKNPLHVKEEAENDENFYKNRKTSGMGQINDSPHSKFQSNFNINSFHFGSNFTANQGPTLFLSPPPAHQNPPQLGPIGLNPIDRLYSMQNQYFCEAEPPLLE